MYQLEVQTVFSAAHALLIAGQREPIHGHDWHVTAWIEGQSLDHDGMLIDFHAIVHDLEEIVKPWRNRFLNEVSPFDVLNPSAERVAETIWRLLSERLERRCREGPKYSGVGEGEGVGGGGGGSRPSGAGSARVVKVRVTEAVGCAAVYRASGV
jgi:6-pyruvoyltetrahydropterin/6-carboxytetrahydropterin synthase